MTDLVSYLLVGSTGLVSTLSVPIVAYFMVKMVVDIVVRLKLNKKKKEI